MPRQDVPYGGAICRLKERIAEIWDKLGEKLHSVNGVTGDAAGNVEIVSGDAAITISEDQVNHQIEIALDSSQLPTASVSSVNGQTGAVALDAGDIPSDNGNVQTDLDALALRVTANGTAISNEVTDRQNADSALQTNINAVSASIPEMSVTPDPYKGVERDAQGRAYGADPASGAVDQTFTTANWISQTGNASPNNLLHRNGAETINATKTIELPYGDYAIKIRGSTSDVTAGVYQGNIPHLAFFDKNDIQLADIRCFIQADGRSTVTLNVRNADGTTKLIILGDGNQ